MATFEQISPVIPLPIVDLQNITAPLPGLLYGTPDCCWRNFLASDKCTKHYEQLRDAESPAEFVQCPFGFSTAKFYLGGKPFAITSFVPFPRAGGKNERDVAKQNAQAKISKTAVSHTIEFLRSLNERLSTVEKAVVKQQSFALHEIRKLNREVKQHAERLCRKSRPNAPETADPSLVNIWKASELMSGQFDAIELLANEQLAELPLNSESEIYRIFHKCAHIYNGTDSNWRITIRASENFHARIKVCDKTFPIIPSALIENALKYSLPNSEITIDLDYSAVGDKCIASVTNSVNPMLIPDNVRIDASVFEKGRRIAVGGEGTGNGLYLARLITLQHGGQIYHSERQSDTTGIRLITFHVSFPIVK